MSLISVVIPTYNRGRSVGRAIESVLTQTYSNVELIVVDDGSTDDTRNVLRRYGERIRVLHQRNGGPAAARYAGARMSRGTLLAFLDSDDVWLPAFLDRCAAVLQRAGDAVPCCISNALLERVIGKHNTSFDNATLFPRHSDGLWWNVTEVLVTRFVQTCQTTVIRRGAYEKAGEFDPTLRYDEDHDLALRLSLLGPWAFIADPLVVWRQSKDSISRAVLENERPLKECELCVWRRFERLTSPEGGKLARQVQRQANRIQAALDADYGVMQTAFPGSEVSNNSHFEVLRRAAGAVYRRSPWYPKMKTGPLPQQSATASVFSEDGA